MDVGAVRRLMRVDLFDFELPDDLIAQRPVSPRDSARLLDVAPDGLHDRTVRDVPGLLRRGDLLVFNDTKVIPARLKGLRPGSDGRQDVRGRGVADPRSRRGSLALLCPTDQAAAPSGTSSPSRTGSRPLSKPSTKTDQSFWRSTRAATNFSRPWNKPARYPCPLYSRRHGRRAGSRGLPDSLRPHRWLGRRPTAGLHFTPPLLGSAGRGRHWYCRRHAPRRRRYLLQPVRVDDTDSHHACRMGRGPEATACAVAATRAAGGRVVSIGTTSLRLPESVARAYDGAVKPWSGETDIFITPGFRFRAVDLLLTNFHLPRSTLFMLVAAFAGLDCMKQAYAHAISERYRLFLRRLLFVAPMSLPHKLLGTDGAARRGQITTAARHDRDAGLHAGRYRRHREGDDAAIRRRHRRRDRAGQHLPSDAATGRGASRLVGRPAQVHELAGSDPDRFRWLPGDVTRRSCASSIRTVSPSGRPSTARSIACTPERSIEIQRLLDADITMSFDECTSWPVEEPAAAFSMRLSMKWAERGKRAFTERPGYGLFGIVQGSVFPAA